MTSRERFIRCACNQPVDRVPFFFYFGPWVETIDEWKKEGITDPNAWCDREFQFDDGIVIISQHVNMLYYPSFETKVLEEHGDHITFQDEMGVIAESIKGKSGIPKIIRNPITCREDWVKIRDERLNPEDPARFSDRFEALVDSVKASECPVQVGSWPLGLFGTLREMIGVEELCCMFYEEPELIHEIMDYLTDFWIAMYEKIAKHIQIDVIHIWEDMSGKSGSLISPAMVREFMLPGYKKIRAFADACNIPVMAVDTDGICDELIPLFEEAGVNLMMPFEVAAGNDIVELRKRFPNMSMMGGIDKMEIAKGADAINKELDRIEPLLRQSGYFPALDHLINPEISYENYRYFVAELRKRIVNCSDASGHIHINKNDKAHG